MNQTLKLQFIQLPIYVILLPLLLFPLLLIFSYAVAVAETAASAAVVGGASPFPLFVGDRKL